MTHHGDVSSRGSVLPGVVAINRPSHARTLRVVLVGGCLPEGVPVGGLCAYSPELTVSAAHWVIQQGITTVVTSLGNFAAHGGNLLRSASRMSDEPITWVTGLPCSLEPTRTIELRPTGEVVAEAGGFGATPVSEGPADLLHVFPWPDGRRLRCYWPHRRYDILTASIMMPSLAKSAERLASGPITVSRSESGHLWFSENSPSIEELLSIAASPSRADPFLTEQETAYGFLRERAVERRKLPLEDADAFMGVTDDIRIYFSHLLLLHNTYETILRAALLGRSSELASETRSDILRCAIDDWMVSVGLDLPNTKDFLEKGPLLPIPPFDLRTDLLDLRDRARSLEDIWLDSKTERGVLEHAARVFVLKEWKFYLNKLLLREFSSRIRMVRPDLSVEQCRQFTITQLAIFSSRS